MNVVGLNVRRFRKERGLTQAELGERSAMPQGSVSDIETGRHVPHYSTLRRLADALGVAVPEFFDETDGRPKVPQLPDTPLATRAPEAIDEQLATLGELDDLVRLAAEMDSEHDALNAWLREYRAASQPERFARRADAELAKQRRASVKLYRLAVEDRSSKILDQRGVRFKTVKQIAIETMEAQDVVQALVESEEARERIESAGETA
jgi:transcriptional regulator with XRE-family HTH domain